MGVSTEAKRKKNRFKIINVNEKSTKITERFRKTVFRALERTEKLRDAIGKFIGDFLAVGWPGFAAAFLYCTMVPAVAGMMTIGGIAFLVASVVSASLGLLANIGLLKYNQHKQDITDALNKPPVSDEELVEQKATEQKTKQKNKKLTYGVKQMMDDMKSLIDKMKEKETRITRKTAHQGLTNAAAAKPDEFNKESHQKILQNLDTNNAGKSTTIKKMKIEARIEEIKQQNQALIEHIAGKEDKGGLLATEQKYAKSRGLRFLAYAFQALATTCGMAGLPFFVFLSTNALVITFLTNPIAISVVVAASAVWGIICGVAFIRDKYKEFKTHEANVNQLRTAVTELKEKQTELNQTKERLFELADVTKEFAGVTVDLTPVKTATKSKLETAYGTPASRNRVEDMFGRGTRSGTKVEMPTPQPKATAVGGRPSL